MNEAITETLAQLALPESTVSAGIAYGVFRLGLQLLLRKMVEARKKEDPSYTLAQAWHSLVRDYLEGTYSFLKDVEKAYGKGWARKVGRIGKERDDDLAIIVSMHESPREGLASDIVRGLAFEDMTAQSIQDLKTMEDELREAVRAEQNP